MIKSTRINRANLDWLMKQRIEVKIEAYEDHLTIAAIIANQILEDEVLKKAGPRYQHDEEHIYAYSRYGYNPGSIHVGDSKVKVKVPRLLHEEEKKLESPESYKLMHRNHRINENQLIRGVLLGLSMRDYGGVVDNVQEGFRMSKSSISNQFIQDTSRILEDFERRQFHNKQFIAMFMDGKWEAGEFMVIILGITEQGEKIPIGAIQTISENSNVIVQMLRNLIERGLEYKNGILFIIDGAKGFKKAIKEVFGEYAFIQRCIWHKRENILSHLADEYQEEIKQAYHQALSLSTYQLAKEAFTKLHERLEQINRSAAASLEEGLEELLTLHKLELNKDFSKSFSTTNCIESLNSQAERHIGKVTYWKNSNERFRWLIAAMLIAEHRMHKVDNYKKLSNMRDVMKKAVEKRLSSKQGHTPALMKDLTENKVISSTQ